MEQSMQPARGKWETIEASYFELVNTAWQEFGKPAVSFTKSQATRCGTFLLSMWDRFLKPAALYVKSKATQYGKALFDAVMDYVVIPFLGKIRTPVIEPATQMLAENGVAELKKQLAPVAVGICAVVCIVVFFFFLWLASYTF